MEDQMNAVLSVVDKAKQGWDGEKDFTQYMREDFIPSMAERPEPQQEQGAIQRYQSYFPIGGTTNV